MPENLFFWKSYDHSGFKKFETSFVIGGSGGCGPNHSKVIFRVESQKCFQITCETVNISFTGRFANDVFVVVVTQTS